MRVGQQQRQQQQYTSIPGKQANLKELRLQVLRPRKTNRSSNIMSNNAVQ